MNIKVPFILILLIGCGLFACSFRFPYHTDEKAYEKLNDWMYEQEDSNYQESKKIYHEKLDKLETPKTTLMDLGAGLVVVSSVLLIFLFIKKISKLKDLQKLTSFSKPLIFVWANLFWIALIPACNWYYFFTAARGDYPPFADSIGIPIYETTMSVIFGFIPLNIFLLLSTLASDQSVPLFSRVAHYTTKEILKEIFWGFFLLLNLLTLVSFTMDGDHFTIIITLFFGYLLLMLRAGQLKWEKIVNHQYENLPQA